MVDRNTEENGKPDTTQVDMTETDTQSGSVTDRFGNEAPEAIDGVDLTEVEVCPSPVCESDAPFIEQPAGYYTCAGCYSTWAGDPENASIVDYVASGEQLAAGTNSEPDTEAQ